MKQLTLILGTALLLLPVGRARAGQPQDPGRIYDPPRIPEPAEHPTLVGHYVRCNDGEGWHSGTVRNVREDSLVLQLNSSSDDEVLLAVSRLSVRSMQVRTGTKGHGIQGATVGGIVGMIAGAMAGVAVSESNLGFSSSSGSGADPVGAAAAGAAFGGIAFATLGAIIGSLIRTDKWEEVALDHIQFSTMSRPGSGATLSLALRF